MTNSNASLTIRRVKGRKDLEQFIRCPAQLYRDDPNWVHPLIFEQRLRLSEKHPVFRHLNWQAWTAWRNGRVVGRISAQIDALHQQRYHDRTGFFGLYESEDDPEVSRRLFSVATDWLRERAMHRVIGPFNLSINSECGLLVDGFDTPPSMMMGHARPYYSRQFADLGLTGCKDLLAYRISTDFVVPEVMVRSIERARKRVRVRPFDRRRKKAELETLRRLFNDAWSSNWNFVPFTEEEFADIGHSVLAVVAKDFVQIAEIDDEPAAFIILMPNLNEILATMRGRLFPTGWFKLLWGLKVRYPRSARIPLMGVKRRWQGSGLGPLIAFLVIGEVRKAAFRKRITETEMSWILEDNAGMRNIIETVGGTVYKVYRIYEKSLRSD